MGDGDTAETLAADYCSVCLSALPQKQTSCHGRSLNFRCSCQGCHRLIVAVPLMRDTGSAPRGHLGAGRGTSPCRAAATTCKIQTPHFTGLGDGEVGESSGKARREEVLGSWSSWHHLTPGRCHEAPGEERGVRQTGEGDRRTHSRAQRNRIPGGLEPWLVLASPHP